MIDYVIREDVLKILSRKSAPWDSYRLVRELPAADVRTAPEVGAKMTGIERLPAPEEDEAWTGLSE